MQPAFTAFLKPIPKRRAAPRLGKPRGPDPCSGVTFRSSGWYVRARRAPPPHASLRRASRYGPTARRVCPRRRAGCRPPASPIFAFACPLLEPNIPLPGGVCSSCSPSRGCAIGFANRWSVRFPQGVPPLPGGPEPLPQCLPQMLLDRRPAISPRPVGIPSSRPDGRGP